MFISNILKQNKATKDLNDKIASNIQSTSDLVKAILPENIINEHETQINEALQNYEAQNQVQGNDTRNTITFKYPGKTLQQAELDYCTMVQDTEVEFAREYAAWNQQMYTAHQAARGGAGPGAEGGVRIEREKPIYITPADTVVKVGQTHLELQFERRRDTTTGDLEILNRRLVILERRDTNDTNMEDNCIKFEGKEKTSIDWETTLKEIKEEGEKLGYSKQHFLKCLLRILSQHDTNLFEILKLEEDPEKIANSLLAKYKTINKKRVFENMLKALTRKKGQSIREVMCQADSLTDRILIKCKTPEEKAFRKYQLMLDALKSFSSEENAKELVIAMKGSTLSGERPDIQELIDTVELAERVNENTRPNKDLTFLNDGTVESCEIFAVNPGEDASLYAKPRTEFPDRSAQHHYGTRSRSKDNNLGNVIRKIDEMNLRGNSNDRRQGGNDRPNRPNSNNREQDNWRNRAQAGDNRRNRERDNSQNQYDSRRRSWSSDRNRSGPSQPSAERTGRNNENQGRQSRQDGPRERLRESFGNRTNSRERSYENNNRDRRNSRDRYYQDRNERYTSGRDQSRSRYGEQSGYRSNQQRDEQTSNRRNYSPHNDRSNGARDSRRQSEERYRSDRRQSGDRYGDNRRQSEERYRNDRRQSGDRYGGNRRQLEDRYRDSRRQSRERYGNWSRDTSRDRDRHRQGYGRDRNDRRQRSQSRDNYRDRMSVPFSKRNLEGIEFPLIQQMDLSSKYCVKCMNSIEAHYPWDCKLFRYYSPTPCDICYNGQHRPKECRKNPNRVDAFSIMLENTQATNGNPKPDSPYTPF